MKFKIFLLMLTVTTLTSVGGGLAGVAEMNRRLERGDRVHISIVWSGAVAGAIAGVCGTGAVLINVANRKQRQIKALQDKANRQLNELEAGIHQAIDEQGLTPEEQSPILTAIERIRARVGRGNGN